MKKESISIPRTRQVLEKYRNDLPAGTFWRYCQGFFPPPFGEMVISDPELAQALADDAHELAAQRQQNAPQEHQAGSSGAE